MAKKKLGNNSLVNDSYVHFMEPLIPDYGEKSYGLISGKKKTKKVIIRTLQIFTLKIGKPKLFSFQNFWVGG
jgi:hypothetical protein